MPSGQSNRVGDLAAAVDQRTAAQENAARQLGHLQREISYGYPPATVRSTRQAANRAVTRYFEACERVKRAQRAVRRG